jgi:hypothetical protein
MISMVRASFISAHLTGVSKGPVVQS